MVKEKYIERQREINLSLTNNEVSSVIKKNITKSACRVYDNGCIGIAGTLGEPDEELMRQAESNLQLQLPYAPEATKNAVRHEDYKKGAFSVADSAVYLKEMEETLAILRKEYPQFIFSNKMRMQEIEQELNNDAGTALKYSDRVITMEILIKHVDSVSVFDDFIVWITRDFDREAFLKSAREQLDAFLNPVELPEGEKQLFIVDLSLCSFIGENITAKAMGVKTSAFTGKIGEKLFDEKFSLLIDAGQNRIGSCFFDGEGSTLKDDKCYLIKNGVFERPYADKRQAAEFGFDNTATAAGAYDSVPDNAAINMTVETTAKSIAELTAGRDAIFISQLSGGDYTGEGNFASPVQLAYLYRDGKRIGKLPEFNVSGKLYEMFGEDYVGAADHVTEECKMALYMKISK